MSCWNYDEFKAELKRIDLDVPTPEKKASGYNRVEYGGLTLINNKPAFVNSWHVGGSSGAGYWGDEDLHSYVTGEPEPEWADLTKVLEHFCPSITFLKYKKLMTITKSDSWSRNDYYGNETNYSYRYVFVENLFRFLNDDGLIEREMVDDSE
jgi:hypothetical protein